MDVGVRELKLHLSEYLERASKGEVIRVTSRGQPRLLLCPVPGVSRLQAGIEQGWIRAPETSAPMPIPRFKSKRRVADALSEDRSD